MTSWESIGDLRSASEKLYIYGTGLYGRQMYQTLQNKNIAVDGFVVTMYEGAASLFGLPILEFKEVKDQDIGIVVGVQYLNVPDVKKVLESNGFNMEKVVWGTDLINSRRTRGVADKTIPEIEITTRIGCKVNCRFCPQSTLVQKYFEHDPDRASVLGLETLSKCLEQVPQNCVIDFCGMSEPLLNPNCLELIKLVISSGRTATLYTTLVGADMSLVEQLCEIPFGFVALHLADKYGYAKIPISDEYYKMVDTLINMKKKDGKPFVNMCNAQGEPDEKIREICEGKYEVFTVLLDRAGNLNDPRLYKKEYLPGPLSCTMCGPKIDHNVLLPDGTLLLCCMDFGMKHVLGNLLENSYEEILNSDEVERVKRGMLEEGEDILCRRCTSAHLRV